MHVISAVLCISIAIVASPGTARAQSASKVIERYIAAIGGRKAVEQIVTSDVSGRVSATDGRSGVFRQWTSRPQSLTVSVSWGDAGWRTGFNGRAAWQDDGVDGIRTLYGPAASRVRAEAMYANTCLVAPEKLDQVSLVGRDEVRGHAVIVVLALTSDGMPRTLYFDASSYLLVKDAQPTDAGVDERFFEDYRAVDRVLEPHRIEWHRNGETLRIAVERVTHNAPLDGQTFDVPAKRMEPPLDPAALLSAAGRREQQEASVRTSYAYTQTATFGRMDEQGRVAQEESVTTEVFHLGGRAVSKVIARNRQPLSETEQRREDDRVKNIVREYERQRLPGQAGRREQVDRGALPSVFVWMPLSVVDWPSAFLRMFDFSHVRREPVRGRVAIVLEFEPKRGVMPTSELEQQVHTMAGALWIDDASQYVMRMESYFREDYNRTVQGSSMRTERTLVNDEVWLPSRSETNRRLSWAFGKHSLLIQTMQCTDHRKFNVATDTAVTLPEPKQ